MRRAALTAYKPTGGALTPVGGDTAANTSSYPRAVVWGGTTAAQSGTVTSVSARLAGGSTIRFFTIRDVAGTWTIRAASGNLTGLSGVNAYTVSLAIVTGDHLGIYTETEDIIRLGSGSGTYYLTTDATSPVAAGTYDDDAGTETSTNYAYVGTGTQ